MSLYYRFAHRPLMRLAHRFNWHYAPPIYPEGDTVLWCKWCGMRYTARRASAPEARGPAQNATERSDDPSQTHEGN